MLTNSFAVIFSVCLLTFWSLIVATVIYNGFYCFSKFENNIFSCDFEFERFVHACNKLENFDWCYAEFTRIAHFSA